MKKLTIIVGFVMTSLIGFSQEKLNVSIQISNSSSYENGTGVLTAEVTGGVGPYHILWSNGMTGNEITKVGKKNYSVRVSDSKGNIREELILLNPKKTETK
tara:strand:- start:735 stop:1037 length:303 start_codon:yes stop_codon:yes gene_type:complete